MYAIRSYYDRLRRGVQQRAYRPFRKEQGDGESPGRITSYNVCYTKLLRTAFPKRFPEYSKGKVPIALAESIDRKGALMTVSPLRNNFV